MSQNEKNQQLNFVGKGKEYAGGKKIMITLDWEDLKKLPKSEFNGKKYIALDVFRLRQASQFGQTHFVSQHIFITEDKAESK